jgi:hypothetical protein
MPHAEARKTAETTLRLVCPAILTWNNGINQAISQTERPMNRSRSLTFVLLLLVGPLASAELKVANVFGDHMVLQQEMPIRVWGWAVSGPNVVIYHKPIDISKLAKSCQLALSNGGHGLVAEFLREGVPQFILPLHCEQAITGGRIADMNAGQIVSPGNPALALQELRRSVENPGAFVGAASFQQIYAHWSNEYSVELAYARLLNSCPP